MDRSDLGYFGDRGGYGGNMLERSIVGTYAPEFPDYDPSRWINSRPLMIKNLRGKIVVVDFWEFTCINCIRTLPYVKGWYARYEPYGIVVIGVHAPEFEFGKSRAGVERAVRDFGLTYPIVLDNDYEIWHLYANAYWPHKYVVAPDGKIIYDRVGEGGYDDTEQILQDLIITTNPGASLPPILKPVRPEDTPGARCLPRTPELYAGRSRGRYGNVPFPKAGEPFEDDGVHAEGFLYLKGSWTLDAERVTSAAADGYLAIPFSGNEVNAVIRAPEGERVRVNVEVDGRPLATGEAGPDVVLEEGQSYVNITVGRMYRLYKNPEYGNHELRLEPATPGIAVYAFTFGSCQSPE
jgi:thiol-disulfide isomerase/thioredoxin